MNFMLTFICSLTVDYDLLFSTGNYTVVVDLPSGRIKGRVLKTPRGRTFYAFQQIPYAAPPVGNLRFKEPRQVQKWPGILDTTENTKVCPQGRHYIDSRETEDCLYLNVYVPKLPVGQCRHMPVLFYIFGGVFNAGHASYDFYSPELFMDNGIIVVTMNYRLGALGFLTTMDNIIPPNLGLKDQLFALKWVHRNIEFFGGNASQITIMGHSSGAASAAYHLHSRQSAGLFRAMIIQSGTSIGPGMIQKYPIEFAYKAGEFINRNFGRKNTSEELLNLLLDLPSGEFRHISLEIPHYAKNCIGNNTAIWAPVMENESIQNAIVLGPMHENIKKGLLNRVPILMGIVTQEYGVDAGRHFPESSIHQYDEDPSLLICSTINIEEKYRKSMGQDLKAIYTNGTFAEDYDGFVNFYSSERFATPTCRHADLQSKYTDVYFYQFSYVGDLGQDSSNTIVWKGQRMVVHAEELAYLFLSTGDGSLRNFYGFPERDILTSDRILRLWSNFIKYLNPTPVEDPLLQNVVWPTVKPNNFVYLDIGNDLILKKDPKEYAQWKKIFDKYTTSPLDVY